MLALFANGPPPPYPTSDAPAIEWAVWGGCLAIAAILGGWVVFNISRSKRSGLSVIALVVASVLVGFATLFVMSRELDRERERSNRLWQEQMEQLKREAEERSQP